MVASAGGWTWDETSAQDITLKDQTGQAVKIRLPNHFELVVFDDIDSTNKEAIRRAEQGASDGLVVFARAQSKGRGRHDRVWQSQAGNFFCSYLFRPTFEAAEAAQLGFVAANAMADTIASLLPRSAQVTCKWPNDVLIEGAKVSGVLLESAFKGGTLDWLVLGVGMNITTAPDDTPYPATSLLTEGAVGTVSPEHVLDIFTKRLIAGFVLWRRIGFGAVRRAWLSRAQGIGGPIEVRLSDETISGTFKALDADGVLLVETPDGIRKVTAGDVFFPSST